MARNFTQNESIQGKLRSLEKRESEQKVSDRRRLMLTPEGRRFMYDLIFEVCGLMNVYPAQDSGIYRHEGARGVGFKLASILQQEVPAQYTLMINEHVE